MKNRKPIPKAGLVGLIVVAALLVAVAGYMLLVKPQQATLAAVNVQIAAEQTKLDDYTANTANRQAPVKIRVADVYRLARAMPATVEMPDILLELDQVASAAGIELSSISPETVSIGNGFKVQNIRLEFSGNFYSVTDLLYRLRSLVSVRHGQLEATGRLFSIGSVTLSPLGTGLQATVEVGTYIYGGAPVPVAPAGAATTMSTDPTVTSANSTQATTSSPPSNGASAQGAP
ncbi:MAG: type 4a pilus biogenesis protein PilO [Gaiellaceae bacterium]